MSTLPPRSRTTVTPGCSASNAAFTFSKGPVRLPAWKTVTWIASAGGAVGAGVGVRLSDPGVESVFVVPVQPQIRTTAATRRTISAQRLYDFMK